MYWLDSHSGQRARRDLERDINGGEDHLSFQILLGLGVRRLSPSSAARQPRLPRRSIYWSYVIVCSPLCPDTPTMSSHALLLLLSVLRTELGVVCCLPLLLFKDMLFLCCFTLSEATALKVHLSIEFSKPFCNKLLLLAKSRVNQLAENDRQIIKRVLSSC